jgi:O-antigen/teichoic acid export membrane protein
VAITLAAFSLRAQLGRSGQGARAEVVSWRELLGYGFVVQASNGVCLMQVQAPKVILGMLGRLAGVTQFELGFKVANALWSLPTLLQMSVVPAAAHAGATGGAPAVREIYAWCCRWTFAAGAWSLCALWLLAPPLFRLWIGSGHDETIAVARWLAVAFLIATLTGPANAVARGRGWPELEAMYYGVALVVNVPLGIALVPSLGAPGAAFAMVVSFAVASVVVLVIFHRRLGVASGPWLKRMVLPRYVPAALLVAALQLIAARLRWDSPLAAILGIGLGGMLFTALYAAAAWRTGDPAALWYHARAWVVQIARAPQAVLGGRR